MRLIRRRDMTNRADLKPSRPPALAVISDAKNIFYEHCSSSGSFAALTAIRHASAFFAMNFAQLL